jgi:HK97 family phage portal protein
VWPFNKLNKLEKEIKSLQGLLFSRLPVQTINDGLERWPDYNLTKVIDQYATIDQVYSVIDRLCTTQTLIPIYPYIKTKESKHLRTLKTITARQFYSTKGIFDIQMTMNKALEDAEESDPVLKLLDKPNGYMTGSEFKMLCYLFYDTAGEAFIYKNRIPDGIEGGANAGKVKELYVIPPDCVSLIVSRVYPQVVTGYKVVVGNDTIFERVPLKDMIHWKRPNPSTINWNADNLRGLSPLKVAAHITEELDTTDKRILAQMKNGAVPGIVYDEDMKGSETEQGAFDLQKQAYLRHSESTDNTNVPFFTGSKKGYIRTGLSLVDMQTVELLKFNKKRLCNIFHVSDILFNSDSASTESNVQMMVKQMYTNACLPIVYSFCEKLNCELAPDFGPEYYITCDISGITELQDDIKKMIEAIAAMPVCITGNEQRALMKYDEIDDDMMNMPLVKSGYSLLSDLQGELPPVVE